MEIDKEWMKITNRASSEFQKGCDKFLEWAFSQPGNKKRLRCPCNKCRNTEFYSRSEIRFHLFDKGFYDGYKCWSYHGEKRENFSTSSTAEIHTEIRDEFDAMIEDACGHTICSSTDNYVPLQEEPNAEASNFYKLLEDSKQRLYDGCDEEHTKLSYVVNLLHHKSYNKWTAISLDRWLKYQNRLFPKSAAVPQSCYDAKKIINQLGLHYTKIDACINDCVLYWQEFENAEVCPTCGESRWTEVLDEDDENIATGKRRKIAHKVLRYFPITPRLQRLYMCRKTAKDMRWHKEENIDNGLMKHPADSIAWKSFDNTYPQFASDSRSVRLGLASDGFNPFGNMSTSYSVWPVVLVPYNLPPWLCMKQPYFMMSLLIPGRKSPGNDIDVYLQPLIKELKNLWEVGVDSYDAYSGKNFTLQAAVLWTINDFPAYGNLSGWVTKGKMACPSCHVDTSYHSLRSKGGYLGHRRFLPKNHRWRNERKAFDGNKEHRCVPKPLSGDDVLKQFEKISTAEFGKTKKRKKDASNWSKKSIFFELPYWRSLLLRHNLDVMHIERNVSDSLLSTLMGVNGKTKDTLKARYDLKDMGIRRELHPFEEESGKLKVSNALYNLSPMEKTKVCNFLKELKVPDGFASNICRCVNVTERKISGMKCHDHHIFLQRILPFLAKGLLRKEISEPLIELAVYFKELCCKVLDPSKLDELENNIAITLCKMEKVFPPAFFDIMIHLPVHLATEAKIAGPVQYRWMYPIERYLRTLKSYVRNNARPEGSIAEGYIVDECVTFCARYINTTDTKFNKVPRNDDFVDANQSELSIFKKKGQPKGSAKRLHLSIGEFNEARMYMLQNCDEVLPFIEQHKAQLAGQNEKDVVEKHKAQFPLWFHSQVLKLHKDGLVDTDLLNFAVGPHQIVHRYDTFVVNGFRFHTSERERSLKCQNSGVVVKGDTSTQLHEYYGVLKDIYKFTFPGNNEVFMFKCHWWDVCRIGVGYKTDKWGDTYVNSSHSLQTSENFVLAVQAEQIYYVKDMNAPLWLAVNKNYPRDAYINKFASVGDENIRDIAATDDGEAYQGSRIVNGNILDLDNMAEDNMSEKLHRTDYEARIVDVTADDSSTDEILEDDDTLNDDDELIDWDLFMGMGDDD